MYLRFGVSENEPGKKSVAPGNSTASPTKFESVGDVTFWYGDGVPELESQVKPSSAVRRPVNAWHSGAQISKLLRNRTYARVLLMMVRVALDGAPIDAPDVGLLSVTMTVCLPSKTRSLNVGTGMIALVWPALNVSVPFARL